jgi:hypothetical protein
MRGLEDNRSAGVVLHLRRPLSFSPRDPRLYVTVQIALLRLTRVPEPLTALEKTW